MELLLGDGISYGINLNLTGSPTFRSLTIQSKNSAAHTVDFQGDVTIGGKFVAIGSSASNKLTLTESTARLILFKSGSTSYGQFVYADIEAQSAEVMNAAPPIPAYIGSNSTTSTSGWILQNPPRS